MNIAIIGNDGAFMEAKAKLGEVHQYFNSKVLTQETFSHPLDVVFDFTTGFDQKQMEFYQQLSIPIFLNTVFTTLATVTQNLKIHGHLYGFCGLPAFFNRSQLEVVAAEPDKEQLTNILTKLKMDYILVKDQIGMVTPRVVCMIINEAYEALQQGVASKEDIDLSMKLGTNYPYGPFEWGDRIGLENVRKVLLNLNVTSISTPE